MLSAVKLYCNFFDRLLVRPPNALSVKFLVKGNSFLFVSLNLLSTALRDGCGIKNYCLEGAMLSSRIPISIFELEVLRIRFLGKVLKK